MATRDQLGDVWTVVLRGPYPIADGTTAYMQHVRRHDQAAHATSMAR